jgi:hypothetical protein
MSEEQLPIDPPKGFWSKVGSVVTSPGAAFSKATKESPAMVLIAILLVVQPVVQTGIELVRGLIEFKQDLDPATRPVTKAELDIVNEKIDFNNKLILADIQADKEKALAFAHGKPQPIPAPINKPVDEQYKELQDKLTTVQKHLDSDFKHQSLLKK